MKAVVRPAERRDVAQIVALWSALMAHGHAADPRWAASEQATTLLSKWASTSWLVRHPFPAAWVAEIDGVVVGFVEGSLAVTSPLVVGAPTAVIESAWVDPALRGRGLGRALVEAFVGAAKAGGFEGIEVNTLTLDAPAMAFWAAMGFGPWRVTLRRP